MKLSSSDLAPASLSRSPAVVAEPSSNLISELRWGKASFSVWIPYSCTELIFYFDYFYISFLLSFYNHITSTSANSHQPSTWSWCVTPAVPYSLPLSIPHGQIIGLSSACLSPWKPALFEGAHLNLCGFSARVWGLTHLSSWLSPSLRQENFALCPFGIRQLLPSSFQRLVFFLYSTASLISPCMEHQLYLQHIPFSSGAFS